ncbi:MAG: 30S ribosome-binding factor RbfA, partial [Xanthomonadales bacterium]|nr:30S ribosome-binding factor RbfA [Xanthomonadales bacterium]
FNRSERVAGQLRRDLARLIQQEIKDPNVGFVSLSDVEVTRDLAHAKVFITVFDPEKAADSLQALRRAATFLRRRLGQELRLRHVPELHFLHDDSVEQGSYIDQLIEKALSADKGGEEPTLADKEEPDQD